MFGYLCRTKVLLLKDLVWFLITCFQWNILFCCNFETHQHNPGLLIISRISRILEFRKQEKQKRKEIVTLISTSSNVRLPTKIHGHKICFSPCQKPHQGWNLTSPTWNLRARLIYFSIWKALWSLLKCLNEVEEKQYYKESGYSKTDL